jgi:hypothetical protein
MSGICLDGRRHDFGSQAAIYLLRRALHGCAAGLSKAYPGF